MSFINKVCNVFYSKEIFMSLLLCIILDTVFLILKHSCWKISTFQMCKTDHEKRA